MSDSIPLSQPDITDLEVNAVVEVLRSGRLSHGPALRLFEAMVARRARRSFGIGVSSGTSGLHLVLLALGIKPGDEVLVPAFTFVAPANAVVHVGAKPVFVDIDPRTLNMDVDKAEAAVTDRTRAIIGVENFGNPAGMADLAALSTKHEIPMIEDACEGLGGRIGTEPVGCFGRAAIFGFYPNKQITTGEGGMIVTDDDRLADMLRSLRNQGRPIESHAPAGAPGAGEGPGLGSWLSHERFGWNSRLSEMSAALGAAQMERLDHILAERARVAEAYSSRLIGVPEVIVPNVERDVMMSWFVYVVRLTDTFSSEERDEIIRGLRRHDIGAASYFPPIPLLKPYREKYGYKPGDFPVTESVAERTIALPFFTELDDQAIDLVCQTLELMIQRATFSRG